MAATALGVLAAGGIAWITGNVAAHNSPIEILGATGILAYLFASASFFFRKDASFPGEM